MPSFRRSDYLANRHRERRGASNFFELAVATAVSIFGVHLGAALTTVVGVLIEMPVMLSVVHIVNRTQGWYDQRGTIGS